MADLKQLEEALNHYVKPGTPPVAVRLCASEKELPERVRFPLRDFHLKMPLCMGIGLARRQRQVIAMGLEDQHCPVGVIALGFVPPKKRYLSGEFAAPALPTREAIARFNQELDKIEYGTYKYVVMAPIMRATFEPHFIIVYGDSAQIARVVQGAVFMTGRQIVGSGKQGGGCAAIFARSMITGDYVFLLPGLGERILAGTQDHEAVITIPFSKIDELLQGFEGSENAYYRYPMSTWLQYQPVLGPGYNDLMAYLTSEEE